MRTMGIARLAAGAALLVATSAGAAETLTYTYDAQGRVVKVVRTGNVNNNVTTTYTLDKAGNRTKLQTTGASTSSSP